MNETAKMSETVILIDSFYLNLIIKDIKNNFEPVLKREFPVVHLSDLVTYISLDAGMQPGENQVQVFWIYDNDLLQLENCTPADLKTDMNELHFKTPVGEYDFYTSSPGELGTSDDLYLESLKLVITMEEVKRLILICNNEKLGEEIAGVLKDKQDKEIVLFRMDQLQSESYRCEVLAFPVMKSLGVKGEEL